MSDKAYCSRLTFAAIIVKIIMLVLCIRSVRLNHSVKPNRVD